MVVRLLEDSGALGVEDEIELERVVKGMAITAYLGQFRVPLFTMSES